MIEVRRQAVAALHSSAIRIPIVMTPPEMSDSNADLRDGKLILMNFQSRVLSDVRMRIALS